MGVGSWKLEVGSWKLELELELELKLELELELQKSVPEGAGTPLIYVPPAEGLFGGWRASRIHRIAGTFSKTSNYNTGAPPPIQLSPNSSHPILTQFSPYYHSVVTQLLPILIEFLSHSHSILIPLFSQILSHSYPIIIPFLPHS